MKKTFNFLFISLSYLLVCLFMGACQDKEDTSGTSSDKIRFSVDVGGAGTRTTFTSHNVDDLQEFYVTAFNKSDFSKGNTPYMQGVELDNVGNGSFEDVYGEVKNWPSYPLDFVATTDRDYQKISVNGDSVKLGTYQGGRSYDEMVAYTPNQTQNSNNGVVKLQFKHLFSKVDFYLKQDLSGYSIDVEEISIDNICKDGSFALLGDGSIVAAPATEDDSYFTDAISFQTTQDCSQLETEKDWVKANDDDIYFTPLQPTPWNPLEDGSIVDMEHDLHDEGKPLHAYIKIKCKIKNTQTDEYAVGSASSYGYLYYPFNCALQPGKHYSYRIKISNDEVFSTKDPQVGYVISDKGKIYKNFLACFEAGENAVAMIGYVGSDTGNSKYNHGLAIALCSYYTNKYVGFGQLYSDILLRRPIAWKDVPLALRNFSSQPALSPLNNDGKMSAPSNSSGWHVPSVDELDRIFYACGNTKKYAPFGSFESIHSISAKGYLTFSSGSQNWTDGNIDDLIGWKKATYGVDEQLYYEDVPWCLNIWPGTEVMDENNPMIKSCIWTSSSYSHDSSKQWIYNAAKQCYEVVTQKGVVTLRPVFAF